MRQFLVSGCANIYVDRIATAAQRNPIGRWGVFTCLFGLLLLLSTDANAFLREIAPGSLAQLGPNEGLLVVSIDTPAALGYVRIQREGNIFSSAKISNLAAGITTKLYAAPAGTYRWDKVGLGGTWYFDISNDAELKFELKAGVVNYPGDLLYRPTRLNRAELRGTNRGLRVLDWLETTYPAISKQLPFAYVGHYPDPFPEFYRKVRAAQPDKTLADLDGTVALPPSVTPPVPVEQLWQPGRIQFVALNPSGDLLAEAVYEKGKWGIDLIDLQTSTALRLVNPQLEIDSMRWFGNRTLIAGLGKPNELDFLAIFQISEGGAKGRSFNNINLPFLGTVIGAMPADPSQLLIASKSPYGQAMVNRIDIGSATTIKQSRHDWESRLNKGLKDDFAWYVDANGEIRLALTMVDKQVAMMYGHPGDYHELLRIGEDGYFFPCGVSRDGGSIYVLTDQGRAQRDLVVYDPVTKTISKTLFSKPGIDVEKLLFDQAGIPIGVAYYQDGRLVSDFFADADSHLYAQIESAFPDRTVRVMGRDEASRHFVLGVEGTDRPFALYYLDLQRHRASLLDESLPELAKRAWAPSQVVRAQGDDGFAIEAYLTMPKFTEKLPLVVLAHGGPIGVRDTRYFDREVQFYASLGYAVLQVNFRGSEGYGRAYQDAGNRSYGTLIEDDIDRALQVALAKSPQRHTSWPD